MSYFLLAEDIYKVIKDVGNRVPFDGLFSWAIFDTEYCIRQGPHRKQMSDSRYLTEENLMKELL